MEERKAPAGPPTYRGGKRIRPWPRFLRLYPRRLTPPGIVPLGVLRLGVLRLGIVLLGIVLLGIVTATAASSASADCRDRPLREAARALVGHRLAPDQLLSAVRRHGSDAPVVDALALAAPDERRRRHFLRAVRRRRGPRIRCGEARKARARLLLVAPDRGSLVELGPARFAIRLAPGFVAPQVAVETARGSVRRRRVGERASFSLLPDERDWRSIQLLATGPMGLQMIRHRYRRHARRRPAPWRSRPAPSLRDNRLLGEVARAQAEVLCRSGVAGHRDGASAGPVSRLRAAGLRARHVGEVAAVAEDAAAAVRALYQSPAHRAALLEPRFTDIGVGWAAGISPSARCCLVVLLAAWPRPF